MAGYFTLELDTTGPKLDIVKPSYTTRDYETQLRITSNEPLSSYQDIYIVDSAGNRNDITFSVTSDTELDAEVILNFCSLGIANLYIRLKDIVDNISDQYIIPINIIETAQILKLTISDNVAVKTPQINISSRPISIRTE